MSSAWVQSWLRVQSLAWLPALALVAVTGSGGSLAATVTGWAVAIGIVVSSVVLVGHLRAHRPADIVTMVRLTLVVTVTALAFRPLSFVPWAIVVAAAAADLVDGVVARRTGPTPHGAQLDMEADQFTVLALAVGVVQSGGMAHVLLLPAMRYVFVLAAWRWQVPAHEPKPVAGDNRRGRLICAAVVVALLLALAPWASRGVGDCATGAAVLLLAWSFSADARHLLSVRPRRSSA